MPQSDTPSVLRIWSRPERTSAPWGRPNSRLGILMLPLNHFSEHSNLHPENDSSLREMLANSLAAVGRPSLAAAEFETLAAAAKVPADKNRLELAAGFAALKAGDSARALAAFRQAVEIEANRKSLEAAAETAFQAGQLTEAAGYLERLAAAGDDDIDSRVRHLERLSFVYEMTGDTRKALEALTRLPKAEQSKPEIIRREAVLAQKLGDRQADAGAFARACGRRAEREQPCRSRRCPDRGGSRAVPRRQASKHFWQSATSRPKEEQATSNAWAISRFRAAIRNERSLSFLKPIISLPLTRRSGSRKRRKAQCRRKTGRRPHSGTGYLRKTNGSRAKPAPATHARLGVALASLARDQEAVAAYDAAIQLGGATPSLHENRGILLMRLGRAAAAVIGSPRGLRCSSPGRSCPVAGVCLSGGSSARTGHRFSAASARRPAGSIAGAETASQRCVRLRIL